MNCILAGVGGQGTVLASKLIAQAGRTAGRRWCPWARRTC